MQSNKQSFKNFMRAPRRIGRGKGKLVRIDLMSLWNNIKGAEGSGNPEKPL